MGNVGVLQRVRRGPTDNLEIGRSAMIMLWNDGHLGGSPEGEIPSWLPLASYHSSAPLNAGTPRRSPVVGEVPRLLLE